MALALIGLGSNLGDRLGHLRSGALALGGHGRLVARSRVYESASVAGPAGAPDYLNAVVALETDEPPAPLLSSLLAIEAREGRVRSEGEPHGSPRPLDLDLLLVGERVIGPGPPADARAPALALPHPRLAERAFVLAPLVDVAPGLRHPLLQRSMSELWRALPAAVRATVRARPEPL